MQSIISFVILISKEEGITVKEKKSLDIGRNQSIWPPEKTAQPIKAEVHSMDNKLNHIHWLQISTTIILAILALWSAYFVTKALSSPQPASKASQTNKSKTASQDDTKVTDQTTQADTISKDLTTNPFAENTDSSSTTTTKDTAPTPPAKNSFKLRILNGTSVPGSAASLKTDLTQKGFNVGTIGNARLKYDKTQVYYIAGQKDQADLVSQNLTGKQTVVSEAQSDLVGSGYQILVVIGKS